MEGRLQVAGYRLQEKIHRNGGDLGKIDFLNFIL